MDNFCKSGFDLPVGLSMALAAEPDAMRKFSALSERQKWEIVSGAHAVDSSKEMKQYVKNIITAY